MASEVKANKISPATGTSVTVSGLNVGSDAQGDILYHDGTDYTRLAKPGTPAGEVLTFATSATAPSWVAASAGGLAGVQVYTASSSTWTKSTRESALGVTITKLLVFITGGGAAGTRVSGSFGMGGGAGGTAIKLIDVSSIASVAITIGAGGLDTGTGSSPSYGNAGGASAFGVAPATVHCTAGGGSQGSSTGVPGAGGVGASGDMNIKGGFGDYQGHGGASFWGGGSGFGYNGSSYVSPASVGSYGSGGGGTRDATAGDGQDGVCLVLEFQ